LTISTQRWAYGIWLVLIAGFALVHALDLRADFPNHTQWIIDGAKYTDEGWYGNAAIRAHLFGNWYLPGDFNPAPAVPVWPFLEWILFFFTGVSIVAARALAIAFFFCNLGLTYLLLRARGARWTALFCLTLLVTSPFLYAFSRLAILEPMLTALTLGTLNLCVRLPRLRRPVLASVWVGVLFTLMMLTKTTAIFLLPAMGWAMVLPLWQNRRLARRCAIAATSAFAVLFGGWMALVAGLGLLGDYNYFFHVNHYIKPPEFYWPLLSLWWSFHGGLWVDWILIPLAGLVVVGTAVAAWMGGRGSSEGSRWGWKLVLDPLFGTSVWAVSGYMLFMTIQNHPQPRYFAVVAFFCFMVVAQGAEALLRAEKGPRMLGWSVIALAALAAGFNGFQTLEYATHPEYTFVTAIQRLARYVDTHPNGSRLLVSISGDDIMLISHLPSLCDDFGTQDLNDRMFVYKPGWYSTWNVIDPDTLIDLHENYSLEQVASWPAFDDPKRNLLVLFKLHPLPGGMDRDPAKQDLTEPLPDDKIEIPVD
jgi:hypothetical protein